MNDKVDHDLDLSPNGKIRRDEILAYILQRSRARRSGRRRLSAAATIAIGLALGAVALQHFGDEKRMLSNAPPSPQVIAPELGPTFTDPLVLRYPHLDVEILTDAEAVERSASRHVAIALERIDDEQLISQLSDTELPFGLLIADGKIRLLAHAPTH